MENIRGAQGRLWVPEFCGKEIAAMNKKEKWMYVGAWSTNQTGGIGIYQYDEGSGKVTLNKVIREDLVAGFMVAYPERNLLYVIDEQMHNPELGTNAGGGGRVFAFRMDRKTGDLEEINHRSAFGPLPAYISNDGTGRGLVLCCHNDDRTITRVARDISGKYVLERVFSDTAIVHYPFLDDGALGEPDNIMIMPSSPDMYACIHSMNLAPDRRTFIACDRNLDQVHKITYGCEGGFFKEATLQLPRGGTMKTGACPRYSVFHPTLPIVYVNSEYGRDLYLIRYDSNGLILSATVDATPKGAEAGSFAPSDLIISAGGAYLYMLYRKINVVCAFSLSAETGEPTMIQTLQLDGQDPRGMRFSPDGRFLLVAERNSGDVATLAVADDGKLSISDVCTGQKMPGNIVFM